MFRKSCGNCHYCNTKRPSDITLGDFWGWEKVNPTANADDKGISLILVNTEKGRKLWQEINKELNFFEAPLKDCMQSRLQYPTQLSINRNLFENDYKRHGFEYVYNHDYSKVSILRRILRRIKLLFKTKDNR